MPRILASLAVLAAMVGILLSRALFYETGATPEAAEEPTTITSYVADFDLHEDGSMDVVEQITVDFPVTDRHGIFRFFDRTDPSQPDVRHIVEDVEVTVDGDDVPVDRSLEDGRYDVLKIGDPDATVSLGEHTYEIRYHLPAVLGPGGDGVSTDSQLYWNLIPGGWQQDIARSQLTVHLPAPAEDVTCGVGYGEDVDPCSVVGEGTTELVVSTGAIDDQTPVTLLVGQDVETPDAVTLPWSPRFDQVFGTNVALVGVVALLALLLGGLGFYLARQSHERPPPFPLMYGPPEGMGPAQASYILNERIGREDYVATLLHAAEHGAIDLERNPDGWTIADKNGAHGWAGLDPVTTGVAGILSGPHSRFVASGSDVAAGQRLKSEIDTFVSRTKLWARTDGYLVTAGIGPMGSFLVLGSLAVVVAIAIWNPLDMTIAGLPFAAFGAAGVPLLATGATTKRTPQGRDLWSRVGGFKRILATPSSEQRFEFSGREQLYTAYIPWAVAFGCAAAWAEKYRAEMGAEPPAPAYFGGYAAGYGHHVDSIVDDFDSTLDSAISSYEETQRSSSSGGGGGFSGGGGGGGGGGGSW